MTWDAYIDAVSAPIGLRVAAEHRPGVTRFLVLATEMAAVLDGVALDEDDLALAPVFTPPDMTEMPND